MSDNIIDLNEYRIKILKLKKELAKEKDLTKRKMMEAILAWMDVKVKEGEYILEDFNAEVDRIKPDPEKIKKKSADLYEMLKGLERITEAMLTFKYE